MKRILVADDKASSRELIRTVLERLGYEVTEAADGQEAVERARETPPDLILLDLQMPRLDGFGAVAAIRSDPGLSRIPVVALTAYAMHGDRDRAVGSGFDAYLTKPIKLAELRAEVARLLGGPATAC